VLEQDPDHQAPRIEFTSAPEVTETPSQTGKAKAQETADVEVCETLSNSHVPLRGLWD
jgi:hypothetical protein